MLKNISNLKMFQNESTLKFLTAQLISFVKTNLKIFIVA